MARTLRMYIKNSSSTARVTQYIYTILASTSYRICTSETWKIFLYHIHDMPFSLMRVFMMCYYYNKLEMKEHSVFCRLAHLGRPGRGCMKFCVAMQPVQRWYGILDSGTKLT